MPSRYIISTAPEAIESGFGLSLRGESLQVGTAKQPHEINNYYISPGQFAPVITNEKPYEIQLFKFGLTAFWAKSEMNLFNAWAEGDSNSDDNPAFPRWRAFLTRVGINSLTTQPSLSSPIAGARL